VIIVNDGGLYPKCIDEFGPDVPISYISRVNGGPAAARNSGIAAADSKYIAYLDDDDEWHPEHLYSLINYISLHGGTNIAYGVANLTNNGNHIRYWGDCRFNKFIFDSFHTIFPLSSCLHKREILSISGGFDEAQLLIGPEDCEFIIRVSDHTTPMATQQCTVTMHREKSMTRNPREFWVDTLDYVERKNGYGVHRMNWLFYYRAWCAALKEGRTDLAEKWLLSLDEQLPFHLRRNGTGITGAINLSPESIKAFCRQTLTL